MNAERRKSIVDAIARIEEARSLIESAATEEREEFEELPEKIQESDKGTAIDSTATALEEAQDKCDDIISILDDAKA